MIKSSPDKTIKQLLDKNGSDNFLYRIPPYQRAYAWGVKDWDCVFDDLYDNDKGYFLGSLICIDGDTNTNEYKNIEVIDGQQRLTTLSILLLAIYSKMKGILSEDSNLLANKKYRKIYDDIEEMLYPEISDSYQYRFLPSIQNTNQDDYRYLIESIFNKSNVIKPNNYGNRNIKKSFDYFSKRLEFLPTNSNDDNNEKFKLLYDFSEKIQDAKIIHITADNAQSAFLLFESLNNRGVPLSAIDLIKNKILEEMAKPKTNEKNMENKVNNDIETNNKNWQNILNNIGEQPNLQERFLRHFYMTYADILPEPPKDNEGKLIVPKVTKSNLIDFYHKQIKKNVQFVFDNLIKKSEVYGLLINPERLSSETIVSEKHQEKLINLKHLGISSAYMLLSFVFDKYNNQDFSKLLDYLEFWFICRHATNEPATNQLDKIFIDLVQSQKQEYDFGIIVSKLDKYLNKGNIKLALKNPSLYDDMSSLARSILIRLEQDLRNKQTTTDFWQKNKANKPIWTIEHIYPQKPKNENDWGDSEQIKQLKEKLHSLGNLTLTCYNSSYSNKKYIDKCEVVDDGKEVGLTNGDIKINQILPQPSDVKNTWTSDEIDKRTEWLIDKFLSYI